MSVLFIFPLDSIFKVKEVEGQQLLSCKTEKDRGVYINHKTAGIMHFPHIHM